MSYTKITSKKRKAGNTWYVLYSYKSKPKWIKTGITTTGEKLYDSKKEAVEQVQNRVNAIIAAYIEKYHDKPPISYIEEELDKPVREKQQKKEGFLKFWQEFFEEKCDDLNHHDRSTAKYKSLYQNLESFEKFKGCEISFEEVENNFFTDFISYLLHHHVYRSKKGQNNNTISKRLSNLKEYLDFLEAEEKCVLNFKRIERRLDKATSKNKIERFEAKKVVLTEDELDYFINAFEVGEHQQKYKDLMIFCCLQGTSLTDAFNLKEDDIFRGVINKGRMKSGEEFATDLHPISAKILLKYDFNLKQISEQKYNQNLKKIFRAFFDEYKKYKDLKKEEYSVYFQTLDKKGKKEIRNVVHKGDLVTSHTGRRTFVSMLVKKGVKISLISKLAGHSKETVLKYIHADAEDEGVRLVDLFSFRKGKINRLIDGNEGNKL